MISGETGVKTTKSVWVDPKHLFHYTPTDTNSIVSYLFGNAVAAFGCWSLTPIEGYVEVRLTIELET